MYFPCKLFKTTDHNLTVNDQHVEFVNSIKGGESSSQFQWFTIAKTEL